MDEFRRRPVNKVEGAPSPAPRVPRPSVAPPMTANRVTPPVTPNVTDSSPQSTQPIDGPSGMSVKPKRWWKEPFFWFIVGPLIALILVVVGAVGWYTVQLSPVNSAKTDKQLITIESGSTPTVIAEQLKQDGLIRNTSAFLWYARLNGVQNKLQAGAYRLAPSDSTPAIIDHIVKGKVDTFEITFLPGATLLDNRKTFLKAGYSEEEIDAAFAKSYASPLFEGKPASADLEGYIYGETYTFGTDASVETILERTFKEFYSVVQKDNLVALYASHGLTLYEGITFASIVQREASPQGDDMPGIAQVFYSRLAAGTTLGSDVTYQYIADKTGVPRDPNIDSPYNTRKYAGLPPGPISAPGEKALKAVATPATTNYFFFLSGDDGVTYFARTLQEHQSNVTNHCQKKCQIL